MTINIRRVLSAIVIGATAVILLGIQLLSLLAQGWTVVVR